MLLYVIIAVLFIIAIILTGSYNRFVKLRNNAREAYSTMDVYLKKRFDLIPNIVETVKVYAGHEAAVFEKVTKARNAVQSAGTPEEKIAGENALGATLKSLFAVVENYPELKADTGFWSYKIL